MSTNKIVCPSCGKELENLFVSAEARSAFWCDECKLDFEIFSDNTMLIHDDYLLAEWFNADEGISGDYNADDPNDVNLLRFDISYNTNPPDVEDYEWEGVEDACYCTQVEADEPVENLLKLLWIIFKEYKNVLPAYLQGSSVKKLGEGLSYLSGLSD